jgi:hypothetical protein
LRRSNTLICIVLDGYDMIRVRFTNHVKICQPYQNSNLALYKPCPSNSRSYMQNYRDIFSYSISNFRFSNLVYVEMNNFQREYGKLQNLLHKNQGKIEEIEVKCGLYLLRFPKRHGGEMNR